MRSLRMVTVPPPTQHPLRSTSTAVPGGSSGGSATAFLFLFVVLAADPFAFHGGCRAAAAATIARALIVCTQAIDRGMI